MRATVRGVVAGREGVQPLDQRHEHVADQTGPVLGRPLADRSPSCCSAPGQSPPAASAIAMWAAWKCRPWRFIRSRAIAVNGCQRSPGVRPASSSRHRSETESCRSPGMDDGALLEDAARHLLGPLVLAAREVQERHVPEQMVAEPVQAAARVDRRRHARDARCRSRPTRRGCGRARARPTRRAGSGVSAASAARTASAQRSASSRAKACSPSMKDSPGIVRQHRLAHLAASRGSAPARRRCSRGAAPPSRRADTSPGARASPSPRRPRARTSTASAPPRDCARAPSGRPPRPAPRRAAALVSAKRSSRKRHTAAPAWASARPGSSAVAARKRSRASACQPSRARTARS